MANENQWTVVNTRLENISKVVKTYNFLGRREASEQYVCGGYDTRFLLKAPH